MRLLTKSIIIGSALVVAAVAIVGLPPFIRARSTPAMNSCVNSLRCIDGATQQWALENHRASNDVPTWEAISPYMASRRGMPSCPDGGKYTLGTLSRPPLCSYPGHALSQ
jgi:hypothetical protein